MEPTVKQLQDTIAQLKESLVNWDYVVAKDGVQVQLPITKLTVHARRGLCSAFFMGYPDEFIDEMWSQLKNPEGTWLYPVGGREEFYSEPIRWANPKRKALAERCVVYLQAKLEDALLKEGGTCS
ncbi:hypothetical protein APK37_04 [Acinetobacter phage APK37.1]|uniref:Uncharacterized protein n=1 Tax=Acinetobacter phage APK37.1 TaxID=2876569 RepID=A0AAE9BPP2_9CAUD|nr:hypothetical protein APK37_04 [Acinetobacter phage APK37.1]